jgi:hypothetical protein
MSQENQPTPSESVQPFVIDTFDRRVLEPSVPSLFPEPRIEPLDDIGQLDEYSQEFAARVLSDRPEWRSQLRMISNEERWAAWLELPAPSPRIKAAWVSTEDWRLTVGFGPSFHAHFYNYPPESYGQAIERALKFLDDFLAERLVLISTASQVTRVTSAHVSDDQLLAWIKEYRCDRLRIESWSGRLDREYIPRQPE